MNARRHESAPHAPSHDEVIAKLQDPRRKGECTMRGDMPEQVLFFNRLCQAKLSVLTSVQRKPGRFAVHYKLLRDAEAQRAATALPNTDVVLCPACPYSSK